MDGATVLITGATDGLGRALAADLAGRGARVLVHGRDRARVDAAAAEAGAAGGYVADLASLAAGRGPAEGGARRRGPPAPPGPPRRPANPWTSSCQTPSPPPRCRATARGWRAPTGSSCASP